jgi:hypothetical protein
MSKGSETTELSIAVISMKTLRKEKDQIPSPLNSSFATVPGKNLQGSHRKGAARADREFERLLIR